MIHAQHASVDRNREQGPLDLKVLYFCILLKFHRCPVRECHGRFKCEGHFLDSFVFNHTEDCIRACSDMENCQFYTFEKTSEHCVLYEDCPATSDCETCASGAQYCSRGYQCILVILLKQSTLSSPSYISHIQGPHHQLLL